MSTQPATDEERTEFESAWVETANPCIFRMSPSGEYLDGYQAIAFRMWTREHRKRKAEQAKALRLEASIAAVYQRLLHGSHIYESTRLAILHEFEFAMPGLKAIFAKGAHELPEQLK